MSSSITKQPKSESTKQERKRNRKEDQCLCAVPCWVKVVSKKSMVAKPSALTDCILEYVDKHLPFKRIGNDVIYGLCLVHARDHLLPKMRNLDSLQEDNKLKVRIIELRLKRCLDFWGNTSKDHPLYSEIQAFKNRCANHCVCASQYGPPRKVFKSREEDSIMEFCSARDVFYLLDDTPSSSGTVPHFLSNNEGDAIPNPFSPKLTVPSNTVHEELTYFTNLFHTIIGTEFEFLGIDDDPMTRLDPDTWKLLADGC